MEVIWVVAWTGVGVKSVVAGAVGVVSISTDGIIGIGATPVVRARSTKKVEPWSLPGDSAQTWLKLEFRDLLSEKI